MGFRTQVGHPDKQTEIVRQYEVTMRALFDTGQWCRQPDVDSQLPDELMPEVYKEFWASKTGAETKKPVPASVGTVPAAFGANIDHQTSGRKP
jgi:hypothetical protein